MHPARKSPVGVPSKNFQSFLGEFRLAGFRLEVDIVGAALVDDVLPESFTDNIFELGDASQTTGDGSSFGGDGPVLDEVIEFGLGINGAVSFDVESIAGIVQGLAQREDVLAEGLSAGQADPVGAVALDFFDDFGDGHFGIGVELGVTEETAEIAFGQAHEGSRLADAEPFAFNGVEDFVDLHDLAVVAPNGKLVF